MTPENWVMAAATLGFWSYALWVFGKIWRGEVE